MTTSSEPGPKVLLMGDSGTGKTQSLKTLIDCGITPFVFATEQNFLQTMKPYKGKFHYIYVSPTPKHSFTKMFDMASKINMLSYENLCKVTDPFKQEHKALMDIMAFCNKFVAQDDGVNYGSVADWNTDRAIVIDSLSGLSDMAFGLVVGNKPVRALPDYGVAQGALKMLLGGLTSDLRCMFICIAHLSREKDELTGGSSITASTVGNKLGPDLPRLFSDVIRARRTGSRFFWDTADASSTLAARHVSISDSLEPSFGPLIDKWKKQGGNIEATGGMAAGAAAASGT